MIIDYNSKNITLTNDGYIKVPKPHTIQIGDIEEDTAYDFHRDFQDAVNTGQNIIPIIVDSYGGDIYALLSILDILNSKPDLIIMTICNGKACSAGAVLLACGTKGYRYATPNSTIMIHDGSSAIDGKVGDMSIAIKEIERVNEQINTILDKNCNQSTGFFKKQLKKNKNADFWLTPDKAKEFSIVDHVGIPNLTYNINYGFNLNE